MWAAGGHWLRPHILQRMKALQLMQTFVTQGMCLGLTQQETRVLLCFEVFPAVLDKPSCGMSFLGPLLLWHHLQMLRQLAAT